jgi:hypothetical protein
MTTEFCANHPAKKATHDCKKCGKPLCPPCQHLTDIGIFCSTACYDAVKQFQDQVNALGTKSRPGFFAKIMAWLKQLIGAAVIIGIVYGVFYFGYGLSTPGEILEFVMNGFQKK